MGGLRWTHKTTRKLAAELRRRGVTISYTTVARLLREQDYSLRTNRKRLAGTRAPERDRQFRLLARRRNRFQNQGWPVISIDTKKKELIGNFKNPGRTWCRHRVQSVRDWAIAMYWTTTFRVGPTVARSRKVTPSTERTGSVCALHVVWHLRYRSQRGIHDRWYFPRNLALCGPRAAVLVDDDWSPGVSAGNTPGA